MAIRKTSSPALSQLTSQFYGQASPLFQQNVTRGERKKDAFIQYLHNVLLNQQAKREARKAEDAGGGTAGSLIGGGLGFLLGGPPGAAIGANLGGAAGTAVDPPGGPMGAVKNQTRVGAIGSLAGPITGGIQGGLGSWDAAAHNNVNPFQAFGTGFMQGMTDATFNPTMLQWAPYLGMEQYSNYMQHPSQKYANPQNPSGPPQAPPTDPGSYTEPAPTKTPSGFGGGNMSGFQSSSRAMAR